MVWSPTSASPAPSSTAPADGPLHGGTANRGLVVRVGDTVRRPVAPCRPATHALLAHLAGAGFAGAPRVIDSDGVTETLTYIEGEAGTPPLAEELLTDAALVSVAELLRGYHEAVAGFDAVRYRWPRPLPSGYVSGLVSHNDVHPANIVFRDGRAVGLIDFDLAGPGGIVWDLAAAARWFAPLSADEDVTDSRQGRAFARFRLLLDAYGLPRAARRQVAEAILANHDWSCAIITEAAAAGHAGFQDYWRAAAAPAARARSWCEQHRRELLAG